MSYAIRSSSSTFILWGFFPRCLPPEWDSVWDRLRSWHIERHRRVGRGPEQCLLGQGGGTSMSGEIDPGRANNLTTPLFLTVYLRFFLVNWPWRSLSLSRASAFRPQPATIPISSLPPWCCALRTMLLWYQARRQSFQHERGLADWALSLTNQNIQLLIGIAGVRLCRRKFC